MIVEVITATACIAAGAIAVFKKRKVKPNTDDAKIQDFLTRVKLSSDEFEILRSRIKTHNESGGGEATKSTFADEIVRQVIKQGRRFSADQIAQLYELLKLWPVYDGKTDYSRVKKDLWDNSEYYTTCRVEAEELVSEVVNG
jgi:hypothetical protein